MYSARKASPILPFALLLWCFPPSAICLAQTGNHETPARITIRNFGRMNDRFYRGGQPKKEEFHALADLGIKTVIDLRYEPVPYERSAVETLGMRYINIPMDDKAYPRPEQIDTFLKLANDPATGSFFVHCAGGRHRTGVMGAVYRFTHDRWNYDQVYAEMLSYDFYTRGGFGSFKQFVIDYWQRMQTSAAVPAPAN